MARSDRRRASRIRATPFKEYDGVEWLADLHAGPDGDLLFTK
jgi:hypothetical protein